MPVRPTKSPRWAHAPTHPSDLADPGAAKRADGWNASEKPPAPFFNWWMNNVGEHLHYLRGIEVSNFFARTSSGVTEWTGVAVSPAGLCVAVGGSAVNYSKAGQRWQTGTPSADPVFVGRVAWGAGLFVVPADDHYDSSPDGNVWTVRAAPGGVAAENGICFRSATSNLFVSVGQTGKVQTSPDGITWTAQTMAVTAKHQHDVAHNGLAGGDGLFVSVGDDGDIHTSPNGVTWTKRTSPNAHDYHGVVYDPVNARWIIVGFDGGNMSLLHSPDGITWTVASTSGLTGQPVGVATDGCGTVLAVGSVNDDTETILVSYDGGVTWESRMQDLGKRFRSVAYSQRSGWLVVGQSYATTGLILQSLRT